MLITYNQEIAICLKMLTAVGMNSHDAEVLAKSVAYSDFSGIYSHGLSRFSGYIRCLGTNIYTVNASITLVNQSGLTFIFDCDNGCGVVAASNIYDEIKQLAKESGIAMAVARRSSNLGCLAFLGRKAIEDNLVMMLCCNTTRCVAPFGGADSFLGTNPIMVCVPAGNEKPILMDISTTNVAFGKILAYRREGKELPAGWALDSDGEPTTDAKKASTVIPIAGPKGYGLSVMVDIFSALFSGAGYGEQIGFVNKGEHENTGFSMVLIDPAKFKPLNDFKESVDMYIQAIKRSKKAEGTNEIYLPGEIEMTRFDDNLKTGIEISDAVCHELKERMVLIGMIDETDSFDDVLSSL